MAFRPAFSLISHVDPDNIAFLGTLCADRQKPDPRKPKKAPTTMIGPDGKIIKIPKPCKERACVARTMMVDRMFESAGQLQERALALGQQLAGMQEEKEESEQTLTYD